MTMIVARSSLSAKFPWSMVIYDTSEDIWKIFKIYGYFGNFEKFENFGKFWIFLKILEKNWKFWKNIPLSPSKFASYFGNFFPNFLIFSKIFNFFPKFSEIFKISKITIDFEYFPNIFRSIINNHTSWKFGWQWRSCYDHCLIEMPLNTRIQLN